jgi:hypothetical protein
MVCQVQYKVKICANYNNGGAIARLGAGTAGQVLQTGGAGANPSWSTLSSDVVRLSTIENQLATAIDLDLYSTTYNNYLHIVRMEQYNTAERVQIKIRQSGSTINNSNYRYTWGGSQINSGATNKANGNQKLLDLGLTQAEATALTGYTPPVAE